MMTSLCIHAHLYQPPREDPWLGTILTEASAAPMSNWNERILRESYAPLAWAREMDDKNRILRLLNCYEWMSFNVGPTLVRWLRDNSPELLRRIREGDEKSRERLGYGNAMAQCYHHNIMPLASKRDKRLETVWAVQDFRQTFGRDPEGMWLPECAVDTESLEALADQGVKFIILAPRQAKAVVVNGEELFVTEETLDIRQPYTVLLPSGASIDVVFYHGALSQSIAFEGLLRDGERFWQRLANEARSMMASSQSSPLLCLATDGETYGHHFTFGEMALAYVMSQGAAKRDNIRISNIAAHLAANPPTRRAVLHEPSSWSCIHGVERWRSDCGCTDGGHGNWNQQWRAPLREALNIMRDAADAHFDSFGAECFTDPEATLAGYGSVLAHPESSNDFARKWFRGDSLSHDRAWKLLAMQEQALAAFASCAWFFDDLARIEPLNAMTFALRAIDLMRESGGPDVREPMLAALEKARSNQPEMGNGRELFLSEVEPRCDAPATLCLLAWLLQYSDYIFPHECRQTRCFFPNISVELFPDAPKADAGTQESDTGKAIVRVQHESLGTSYVWRIVPPSTRRMWGKPFVRLEDCSIHIRPEAGGEEETSSRSVAELARPMRDFILSRILESWEHVNRPELRAVAANAVSTISPWEEAQQDIPRPEFWVGFIPYMVVESMLDDELQPRQRMQVEKLLSLHLTRRSKALARRLVTEAFLGSLEEGKVEENEDRKFAEWARRVRFIMPDMDWWPIQNTLWGIGLEHYPALAAELGFAGVGMP